jgi:hypothetical protein
MGLRWRDPSLRVPSQPLGRLRAGHHHRVINRRFVPTSWSFPKKEVIVRNMYIYIIHLVIYSYKIIKIIMWRFPKSWGYPQFSSIYRSKYLEVYTIYGTPYIQNMNSTTSCESLKFLYHWLDIRVSAPSQKFGPRWKAMVVWKGTSFGFQWDFNREIVR